MRVPRDSALARTWPLTQPDRVLTTLATWGPPLNTCQIDALLELLHANTIRHAQWALRLLEQVESPIVQEAMIACLFADAPTLRQESLESLTRRRTDGIDLHVAFLLEHDASWPSRRAAVQFFAQRPEPYRQALFVAATDPHWRVRHALVQVLCTWDALPDWSPADLPPEYAYRLAGVLHQVASQRGWTVPFADILAPLVTPPPFFDADPAVMARQLEALPIADCVPHLAAIVALLAHEDERLRRWAVRTLRTVGTPTHWANALTHGDDPRTGAVPSVRELFARFDQDDLEAIRADLTHRPQRSLTQQMWLQTNGTWFMADRDRPPYSSDHPLERAKRLTVSHALEFVADPTRETSWHVLAQAAQFAKVPLWSLAPEEAEVLSPVEEVTPSLWSLVLPAPARPRLLGPQEWAVSPLGVSGHYGLPAEGFVQSVEAGVNLFFWEPNYGTLTTFAQRLGVAQRDGLYFVAGTFEATPREVRRDCERALRLLRLDRLALFLLFWTRGWHRLDDDLRQTLDDLKHEGKVRIYSLSTHDRSLAVQAIEAGWNPVMVRHSAAHRKAEREVFPYAVAHGTSVITFNNTCYGRLLQPLGPPPTPTAADCYRYTLKQPSVAACWTAPATLDELQDNLLALHDPELTLDREQALLQQGALLYANEKRFLHTIRSR